MAIFFKQFNGLILLITLCIPSAVSGQFFSYAKAFSGTNGTNTYGIDIKTDYSGNVFNVGTFYGTVDFDPGPGNFDLLSAGNTDIYVTKLDSSGNLVWAFRIGSINDQYVWGFELDLQSNIVIYGSFKEVVDFDPGPGITNLTGGTGTFSGLSGFIAKYDTSGNLLMANQLTSPGFGDDVNVNCLVVENNNDLILFGHFSGTVDFDPGPAVNNLTSINDNAFILKLDGAGIFQWVKKMGINQSSIGWIGTAYDNDQSIFITGNFSQTSDFNPDPTDMYVMNAGNNYLNGFALKLTTSGDFVWAKNIGSYTANDNSTGVAIDPGMSGVYFSGRFYDTVIFDSLTAVTLDSPANYSDFLMKLDSSGSFQWVRSFGSTGYEYLRGVVADEYGVYASGAYSDTIDFYTSGSNLIVANGVLNAFVCKYTHDGIPVWIYNFINPTDDVTIVDLHCDDLGYIYTTGSFETTTDFDPGPLNYNLISMGSVDIFVHRTGMVNTTDIIEIEKPPVSVLYPNPVNQKLTIQLDKEYKQITLKVYNTAGVSIIENEFRNLKEIETGISLATGTYFFELSCGESKLGTHKIIVQ